MRYEYPAREVPGVMTYLLDHGRSRGWDNTLYISRTAQDTYAVGGLSNIMPGDVLVHPPAAYARWNDVPPAMLTSKLCARLGIEDPKPPRRMR